MEANSLADFVSSGMLLDMTIGMILGMVASPLMMKGIRVLRQKRKLNRALREIAEARSYNSNDDSLRLNNSTPL